MKDAYIRRMVTRIANMTFYVDAEGNELYYFTDEDEDEKEHYTPLD